MKRVAICAVAQHRIEADIWNKRFQGMLLEILEDLQVQTGFTFDEEKGVRNIVTCSDDFYDGRTISDNAIDLLFLHHFLQRLHLTLQLALAGKSLRTPMNIYIDRQVVYLLAERLQDQGCELN